jgi:hypothetical protein
MRKTLALLLCAAALVTVLAACGQTKDAAVGEGENTQGSAATGDAAGETGSVSVGGWNRPVSPVVTGEIRALLDQALDGMVGVEYTPVAYLSNQVVAGMNHAVLCKAAPVTPDAKETYAIVYLYEKLDGSAEITDIRDTGVETNTSETLSGGWTDAGSPVITEELAALLDQALEKLVGVNYEPLALLSTQVVAGTNYRILCEATVTAPGAETTYVMITLYEALDGHAEMTDTQDFTLQ